jgi:hypothetical protein
MESIHDSEKLLSIIKKETEGVYSFPFMKKKYCEMFLEEYEAIQNSGLEIQRPNSMYTPSPFSNKIGIIMESS